MHADSASPHATSRSGVEEGEGKMATPVPPPFDDAAKQMARSIAAAAGKPKTRDEGLKAIHAVTHRSLFSTERLAWEHFGTTKQRFYEWKQLATTHHRQGVSSSPMPPPAAPPADEAASAAAAVAARERKTELQRERRQGEDSIIRAVVESLVAKIERAGAAADRKAWRARCTWRCPGGCRIDASDCARAAWRLRCMPSRAEVELQMSSELHTPTWQGIEYRSPSGYRYGARKLQQQVIEAVAAAQAFDMRDRVELSEEEYEEERLDFIATWDGKCDPLRFWVAADEYRGCNVVVVGEHLGYRKLAPTPPHDRFGGCHTDEVGPYACARRSCEGCCYCRGVSLPVYLEMAAFRIAGVTGHVSRPSGFTPFGSTGGSSRMESPLRDRRPLHGVEFSQLNDSSRLRHCDLWRRARPCSCCDARSLGPPLLRV